MLFQPKAFYFILNAILKTLMYRHIWIFIFGKCKNKNLLKPLKALMGVEILNKGVQDKIDSNYKNFPTAAAVVRQSE